MRNIFEVSTLDSGSPGYGFSLSFVLLSDCRERRLNGYDQNQNVPAKTSRATTNANSTSAA